MPYTAPVIDRSYTDIVAKNSKAYMNVSDYLRIYRNTQIVSLLSENMMSAAVDFISATQPTTSTISGITAMINNVAGSVENIRDAVASVGIPNTASEVKHDWASGVDEQTPDYVFFNLIESVVDEVWNYYSGSGIDVFPVLTADLVVASGNVMYVDGVDTDGYNIELNGTAGLYIL